MTGTYVFYLGLIDMMKSNDKDEAYPAYSTDKISTHDYTEIVSSLKCTWNFCIFVLLCLNTFFTVYHYRTLSLFSLKAGDRRDDGYFVAVGIVICRSTNCGATGGVFSWTIFFRCSISMIFPPDFIVIHTSLECT